MATTPEGLRERELEPGVLRWVLDNPARRNAIGPAVFEWIAMRCAELRGEVVIVRGAGEHAFTAGFDLTALAKHNLLGQPHPPDASLIRATSAMQSADATFVAALNGYVIGAGVELISACDFRLACPDASLRLPAGKLGVVYHAAGLTRIHAAFGPAIARRLLLAGEKVDISDARPSLSALVERAQLDEQALALARRIREQSARSVAGNRTILRALDRAQSLPADLLEAHEQARRDAYRALASNGEG
ncbi:Carnitinyl-CoA dehydratase [Enhygromyxa salina]|uniref:Carnitinyl-CoA dehydratase n=1 Tax=Enhygromyxa salina TaxID=215803 RepID=A0A2S9YI30_9BACT|nr:enoyl-CoA hydratase/isomerase family protein [Enhygromyxa salina]PRQ04676.1 Carnitinyl-CoA dehydratase [Enhygromyxa salina]